MVQLWWVLPLGRCLDTSQLLPFLFRYVLRKETEHRGMEKTNEGFFFNYCPRAKGNRPLVTGTERTRMSSGDKQLGAISQSQAKTNSLKSHERLIRNLSG